MKPAISVHNLSKQYRIGKKPSRDNNLTENIRRQFSTAWDKVSRLVTPNKEFEKDESFWALKDVSFEVQPGEVVGIIGRNGAGKSTLLKILSQIVEPTSGHADIRGRMGSLLEVGTGFHPELTGRENIYLNGAILGMKREEITKKFDEIVDFSGVEDFLDTPVKRYSSGMHVRLAFAVAAHLDPEILVVDEVLAVGDASFQAKCLGKMKEVAKQGRTVLFVTHSMGTIAALCTSALRMEAGSVVDAGPAAEQVSKYMSSLHVSQTTPLADRSDRSGSGDARFVGVGVWDDRGCPVQGVTCGTGLEVRLAYRCRTPVAHPAIHMALYNDLGTPVCFFSSDYSGDILGDLSVDGNFYCQIPELSLAPGRYQINVALTSGGRDVDHIAGAMSFEVEPGSFFPTGRTPPSSYGYFLCRHQWSTSPAQWEKQ